MSAQPLASGSITPPTPHTTYSSLVESDADLVGHVAYAFYKRDKLKFCEHIRATHGRSPTQQEVDVFIQTCNLDTRLQGYRAEAEVLLERFTEYQLEDAVEEVRRESNERLAAKLSESKSWGRSIAEALVGSLFVAMMWALLVVLLYANKVGTDKMAKDIFSIDLNSSPQQSSPQPASK
ncbi:hypothetical protein [Azohydromonas caseinilytica]|uniref:Uncharacterized protein n=1 Tax=Azohydromonas caseinilytica TaxID=2728836 RepID=A0A848F454_9BURK|nr:hypothetical protein [Azohydromonas caseinilytica]NML13858.1 hypothetical protein [Azohydromonas caseinilytica]